MRKNTGNAVLHNAVSGKARTLSNMPTKTPPVSSIPAADAKKPLTKMKIKILDFIAGTELIMRKLGTFNYYTYRNEF